MSMLVAAESSEVVVDGRRCTITAGVTRWDSACPELLDPEVARLFGMARGSRSTEVRSRSHAEPGPSTPPERSGRPSFWLGPWHGEPTEPRLRTDDELQRTARHEAGHAAAAYLLGWEVRAARVESRDGSGAECEVGRVTVLSPRDLDPGLRARQFATMTLAAKERVGWSYDDADGNALSYRSDRRQAWDALARVGGDPRATGELYATALAEAKRLAADSTFRWIARAIEVELLEQGELRQPELGRLLARAKLDAWNPRGWA